MVKKVNSKKNLITHVVLCGGSGSRLWPLSRNDMPKQFLNFTGETSLFQQTINRMVSFTKKSNINYETLFVTNEKYRFLALEQIGKLKNFKIILEPFGKNTAPSLVLASIEALKNGNDPILIVTPSDHVIKKNIIFEKCLKNAVASAKNNNIILFGIEPDKLKTGYGFIRWGDGCASFKELDVQQFIEKPNVNKAKKFTNDGKYLWNSGIFVMRASVCLAAMKKFEPHIYNATFASYKKSKIDNFFIRPNEKLFNKITNMSIDHALMEKLPGTDIPLKVIKLNAGWSDLGAWDSIWEVAKKDQRKNVIFGDVVANNTSNSLIYSTSRLVATSGMDNIVVIETADSILILNKNEAQGIKNIVNFLSLKPRDEISIHRKVFRPWGWFNLLDHGPHFKVKRIQVKPGASLSLQKHFKRAEHWVVIKGVAEIISGNKKMTLKENESTFIARNTKHKLSNPGKNILEIIEVQSGIYLGEDDIVRFEDQYGRV